MAITFEHMTRHARGAWPRWDGADMTHSAQGAIVVGKEIISFTATRHFLREGKPGERLDVTIALFRGTSCRELTAAKWEATRREVRVAFREMVEAMADDSTPRDHMACKPDSVTRPTAEAVQREVAADMGFGVETVTAETPVKIGTVKTIDCTPTWSEILPAMLLVMTDGSLKGREEIRPEFVRMARLADLYVASQKGA